MKNEIFARAVTELDDSLIAEAHEAQKGKLLHFDVKRLGLIAACLVLGFISLITLTSLTETKISYNGKKLDSSYAVAVSFSGAEDSVRTLSNENALVLKVSSHKTVNIAVSDGTLYITKSDGTQICDNSAEVKAPLLLEWYINTEDTKKTYFLTLNNSEFSLFYNSESASWEIIELRKD